MHVCMYVYFSFQYLCSLLLIDFVVSSGLDLLLGDLDPPYIPVLIVSSCGMQGPSRLVAEEGKSKCAWVTLDDVTNRFIRGWLPIFFEPVAFMGV
jgi:hypothetical protein